MAGLLRVLLASLLASLACAFRALSVASAQAHGSATKLQSWRLTSKGGGGMPPGMPGQQQQEISCVGQEGELYFHPSKKASIKLPSGIGGGVLVGKPRVIPILPYGQVLSPTGSDWLNILEMKHRMLLNEGGVFGFTYYSNTQSKLALVGTLARVKERRIQDDGRAFVVVEGLSRFYIDEVVSENPYLKARVQLFTDYTETTGAVLDDLENKLLRELRANMRMVEKLFPSKNFTITQNILQNRPHIQTPGVRSVKMVDEKDDMARRTKFSLAVLDMLQISSTAKLSLMQEHLIERRLTRFLKILKNGGKYLQEELAKKGLSAPEGEVSFPRSSILDSTAAAAAAASSSADDLSLLVATSGSDLDSSPSNFKNGHWEQGAPIMM